MVETKSTNTKAMMIIGMLFFIFGFVTWLNGTLIPFLKLACELENDIQAFFVTSAFYMAYFFLALPSAMILKKTGFKNGMALGLLVMAVGSAIFIPAWFVCTGCRSCFIANCIQSLYQYYWPG
jgi:MFS transporter, FHS family, L-fucose permease